MTAIATAIHPQVGALLHEVDAVHLSVEIVEVFVAGIDKSVEASLAGVNNLLVERGIVGLVKGAGGERYAK